MGKPIWANCKNRRRAVGPVVAVRRSRQKGAASRARRERQSQLDGLSGLSVHSSALDALTRRTQAICNEVDGMRISPNLWWRPALDNP